jgi:hypothetical protein|tara:strand:+ start:7231 stop:7425 length:195 start_codon:yes stop_codon:yes gene_type:complete
VLASLNCARDIAIGLKLDAQKLKNPGDPSNAVTCDANRSTRDFRQSPPHRAVRRRPSLARATTV